MKTSYIILGSEIPPSTATFETHGVWFKTFQEAKMAADEYSQRKYRYKIYRLEYFFTEVQQGEYV